MTGIGTAGPETDPLPGMLKLLLAPSPAIRGGEDGCIEKVMSEGAWIGFECALN